MRLSLSILIAGLLTVPTAQAKSIKKMTDGELVEVVRTHSRASKRLDAIDELASRKALRSIPDLVQRCTQDPNPEVCTRVVQALNQMDADPAYAGLLSILEQDAAPVVDRQSALTLLVASDKNRIREALPALLARYRKHPDELGADLVRSLVVLNEKRFADLTVLIAKDKQANRPIRLAALKAAEQFEPPRLWAAWIGMLNDPDSRVRSHCVSELGRADLPSVLVEKALRKTFTEDVEGNVRAAAAKSLAQYAHPGLVPDLNEAMINERHPVAWRAALDLLMPLADSSSVPSLVLLLERDRARRIKPEVLEIIVRKLAHIGDPSIIQNVYAIEQNRQGTALAKVCRKAVESLEAEDVGKEIALQRLQKDDEIELRLWNQEVPDPQFPPLNVELSGAGEVIYLDGN